MNAKSQIIHGQLCLYAGISLCILLKPRGLAANDGISYFGIFRLTFLPYALGLLGAALFCLKAASIISPANPEPLRLTMALISFLTVIIVVTPYSVSSFLNFLHMLVGSILFIVQLLFSGWLVNKLRYNFWILILSLAELSAGIGCLVYLKPSHGFLLQFQLLFQLAFGALLIYGIPRLQDILPFIANTFESD
jgi:hypothetical protein